MKQCHISSMLVAVVCAAALVGCSAQGVSRPPVLPTPTATATAIVDYPPEPSLEELVADSAVIATVKPRTFRYEVTHSPGSVTTDDNPAVNPMAGMPDPTYTTPPSSVPHTIVSAEVIESQKGDLPVGTMIEISYYGGVVDDVLVVEEGAPRLADHIDENIVITLSHTADQETNHYSFVSYSGKMWTQATTQGEKVLKPISGIDHGPQEPTTSVTHLKELIDATA